MKSLTLTKSKILVAICNFLLTVCGCSLVTGGLLILFDSGRILLSRLLSSGPLASMPQPFLYYVAIGIISAGLIIIGIGIIGCWASCLHSYFLLTVYFLLIMAMLIGECAIYTISWVWPHCIGLDLNGDELTKTLQSNYGVSGQEQFTAAIDLTQAAFKCCGVVSANEYDTSLWRLQDLAPNKLSIPFTCCILNNFGEPQSYLNPNPRNATLCQALEFTRHEGFRHKKGCIEALEQWYKQQYVIFLVTGLVVVLVEFLVLLSIIFAFTKVCRYRQATKIDDDQLNINFPKIQENVYERRSPFTLRDSYATSSNSFKKTYGLADKT
ncbi:hypothetical protein RI129_000808 [Pyrocoelia pectoralis]|uniref:Tetraspanin n=1 Tax=Pyrocoelia pectoralis TaxID=417401 RepID=A0AAN7VSJ4_9COLE